MAPQGTWAREFLYVPSFSNLTVNKNMAVSVVRRDYG
jgi:hypothetical protein